MLNNHMKAALERDLPAMAAKPRILICAPSNAAADELLQRVMDDRFADGDGRLYSPNVIRIGRQRKSGSACGLELHSLSILVALC